MSDDGSTPVLDVPLLGVPDVPPKQPPQQRRITVKGFGAIYLRGSTWYLDYWTASSTGSPARVGRSGWRLHS